MIRTEYGKVEFEGDPSTFHSDLAVIVHGLNYAVLPEFDMTPEEAKEFILDAFETGMKTEEEVRKEKAENLKEAAISALEKVLESLKGKGDK